MIKNNETIGPFDDIPAFIESAKQSLEACLIAALGDETQVYQLALGNVIDHIAMARFVKPHAVAHHIDRRVLRSGRRKGPKHAKRKLDA